MGMDTEKGTKMEDRIDRSQVEAYLREVPEIDQVAVLAWQRKKKIEPVHLSDLFPDFQVGKETAPVTSERDETLAEKVSQNEQNLARAINYGAPFDGREGDPKTLVEALEMAAAGPADRGITYVLGDGGEEFQSYAQLLEDAKRILGGLRRQGLEPLDSVLFQFDSNRNFLSTFWACLLGGFLPTPVGLASDYTSHNDVVQKLYNSWLLLNKPLILTDAASLGEVSKLTELWQTAELQIVAVEPLMGEPDEETYPCHAGNLALNLLTSGSTGKPKCVQHRHQSVLAFGLSSSRHLEFTEEEVIVNWMPLDHVGGIVMMHVFGTVLRCAQVHAKIDRFIGDPLKWLDWMTEYRATYSWAPNFAYGLVNEQKDRLAGGKWDLSTVRYILNGGEAVSPKTALEFLGHLAPFGLPASAMLPAYGMSETSSGCVFSRCFNAPGEHNGIVHIAKSSLGGQIEIVDEAHPDRLALTEVGETISGVMMRIVDENGNLLPENRIGRLQLSGPVIMAGYYKNSEANEEVFIGEGWFNTGDLGFLHRGRLTLTGREKDVIIIHGKNHHNYEIEAFVEEVNGVPATFSAACAVPDPRTGSETLAIFFVPADTNPEFQAQLIRAITQQIIRKVGITPGYVIPIEEHEFPKSGSGKIQRSRLSKTLLDGGFDAHLKQIDIMLGNHNTVPQWMYRPTWVVRPLLAEKGESLAGDRLILADHMGLAQHLSATEGKTAIVEAAGIDCFERAGEGHYRIALQKAEAYTALMNALTEDGFQVRHIFHLWNVTPYEGEVTSLEQLRETVGQQTNGLLHLLRAIAPGKHAVETLTLVTTALEYVREGDPVAFEKAPLVGILKTIPNEFSSIRCLHVDLAPDEVADAAPAIEAELVAADRFSIALRAGQRFVPCLEQVSLLDEGQEPATPVEGGLYLIPGGLGGIGKLMSEYLIKHHRADVVCLGRSELSADQIAELENGDWQEQGGSLSYRAVNIADPAALRETVRAIVEDKGKPLAGVIHLAGVLHRHLLAHQTGELLDRAFEAKVYGCFAIHQVLHDYPDALLITTSSAGTLTGDMMLGAYTAANRFVESFSEYRFRVAKAKTRCFAWGSWDQTGMSVEMSMMREVLRRRGFMPISAESGIYSLRRALMSDHHSLFVGLDGSKPEIEELLAQPLVQEFALRVFFTTRTKLPIDKLRQITSDYLEQIDPGGHHNLFFFPLVAFPELSKGVIDREKLRVLGEFEQETKEYEGPRTLIEGRLVPIWQEVLEADQVGIHDDFFGIGGHSLKAMKLVSAIHNELGFDLSLTALFENPTVAKLATVIQQSQPSESVAVSLSAAVADGDGIPMTYVQKQLWIAFQIDPDSPVYNNTLTFHLQGNLEIEVLKNSLRKIIDRHDVLRARFELSGSEPIQVIRPEMRIRIPALDLTQFPEKLRANKLISSRRQEARTPFNLKSDPLIRALILRMTPESHYLVVSIHHIVFDDWSASILMNELITAYNALLHGEEPGFPELPIQYTDFAVWQRDWFAEGNLSAQLDYWKQQFAGGVPVLSLPTDHVRPAIQSHRGRTREIHINRLQTDQLRALSRERDCTLYMTLLGAFAATLYRYSSQEEVVIGSVVAHRNRTELQSLIGYFVNTLPILFNISGQSGFDSFLQQVRELTLAGFDNQDVPFEMIIDRLRIARDPSRPPLCQAVFTFQNLPVDTRRMDKVSIDMVIEDNGTSKWDLSMYALEVADGLLITLEYNTDLFLDSSMERFLGHFTTLVGSCLRNPEQQVDKLAMVPGRERKELLNKFNSTARIYPTEMTMTEWFEKGVAETPNKVAIIYDEQPMSYAQLDGRANQVAHYLRAHGVAPDVVVGMLMERSHEMIIGILAILKAGGAYLPLNPKDPRERIEYVASDSEMLMMLTQKRWLDKLELNIPCLDLESGFFAGERTDKLENINADCDLAYVIYTSGSTGRPKGVMIEHASMINVLFALQEIYPLEENDAYLLKTAYTFDVSVVELFGWILGDGKLVILEPEGEKDPQAILDAIERHEITHINFVPSALHLFLLDADQIRVMEKLKYIFVAGEAISHSLVNRLFDTLRGVRVENLYGPTEATIYATYHSLSKTEDVNVPIGQPLPNLRSFIVNKEGQLQPINVAGELCISGKGLARGYLNHPEMTNEKFVRNPNVPNQIMYRTGDLARWRSDGSIEFLGRIDDQVKIRGFRIELGEIKARLEEHERVKKAVVIAQKDERGQAFLAAYLVSEGEPNVAELRTFLAQHLPNYMIPAFFVPLDEVPLNASGKLNRKALPPITGRITTGTAYQAPSTPMEEGLVEIWQEVMGLDRVGVNDNFFEIGGNSLSATMIVTRANKNFRVNYPLREMFHNPTIKSMAGFIETADESIFDSIEPIEQQDYYLASSAQKRVYVIDYFQTVSTAYNMPVVVPIEGPLDAQRLRESLAKLAERHDAFRTSFAMMDKDVIQKVADHIELPLEMAGLGDSGIDEAIENFIRPFDLGQAPLARARLVKLFEDRHLLLIDMHHVVTDGVSLALMLEELFRHYNGEVLPQVELQYKDYSHWQHQLMRSDAIRNEREYWISHFSDQVPVLDWATDFPRPALQQYEGDRVRFTLPAEQTQGLLKFCSDQGVTLYMSLMAAYFVLLSKYVGQEDIVVGSPIAGRPHADLEKIIGMFVNLLAIRERPEAELTVAAFLESLRDTVLAAFENANYPFEEMVESLKIQRDLSRNPVFDVLFTLQNMAKPKLESEGLEISYYEYEENVAKFDLIAVATQHDDTIGFEFEYCTKIFRRDTILKMGQHYLQAITAMVAQPHSRLGELDITTGHEKHLLLETFNQTEMVIEGEQTLHGLFEAEAARQPHRVALVMGEAQMTFGELKARTDHLAMHLRRGGLQADQVAGIVLTRSFDMIVSILGILKAGGAYLCLEPEDPTSRKAYILADSRVSLLLSRDDLSADLDFDGRRIDLAQPSLFQGPLETYTHTGKPADMAYIIYTSGSTGQPKGVVLEHGGAVNTLAYLQRECPLLAEDTYLFKTSCAFDVSVTEIFGWIFGEGRLAILEPGAEKDPERIIEAIAAYGVTHLNYVPSALQVMLGEERYLAGLRPLKYLMVAGEAVPTSMAGTLLHKLPEVKLENIYGPTEATIYATHYPIRAEEVGNMPIGKPIANTRAYILDSADRLQMLNVPGELCVAGPGLARGYLGKPELTAEKFIDNPVNPGERLYRTGDLARWRPDGHIEFMGRIDTQVKVRGYRIELGEIKSQLEKHEAVREALIAVRHDEEGQAYLCAYLIAEQAWTISDLRRHLLAFLPTYMVPAYFHELSHFPKTASGKIDYKLLPEPNREVERQTEFVAASSELEQRLIEIWEDILDITELGVGDNFFDLGGDSIKAIQISSKFNTGREKIFINDILQHQNIREICRHLRGRTQAVTYEQGLLEGSHEPLPPAQWFRSLDLPEPGYFNQSFLLDVNEVPEPVRLQRVLQQLVAHHDELRIDLIEGKLTYNNAHLASPPKVELVDLGAFTGDALAQRVREHCQAFKAFDLTQDLLVKVLILRTGPTSAKMLLTMHHLVTDGVSWRIFLEHLMDLYRADKQGQTVTLPPKTASVGQWRDYLEQYAESDELQREKRYWDAAHGHDFRLPQDRQTEDHRCHNQAMVEAVLDRERTNQLVTEAHKTFNTEIKDLLVTALARALSRWTGERELAVEFEGHGRYATELELSRTIGWFTNMYPVKLQLEDGSIGEQVKAIKEQLRAVPNKGLGYGVLEYIGKAYADGVGERAAVRFNYLGRFDKELNNEWFTLSDLEHGPDISPDNPMTADLEINSIITDDEFRAQFNYNSKAFDRETIQRLGDDFIDQLRQILSEIVGKDEVEFTPSDFDAADMDQEDLDELFA